jgi:hypothetical protein
MKVDQLNTDHMISHLWPALKKRSKADMTAVSYYLTFQNLLELCVSREQMPSNVGRNAKAKTLTPRAYYRVKKIAGSKSLPRMLKK